MIMYSLKDVKNVFRKIFRKKGFGLHYWIKWRHKTWIFIEPVLDNERLSTLVKYMKVFNTTEIHSKPIQWKIYPTVFYRITDKLEKISESIF